MITLERENTELDKLLGEYAADNTSNRAHGIVQHVAAMRRFHKEGVFDDKPKGKSNHWGPGLYNKRRTDYDTACNDCGEFIPEGTVCWLTVGTSPNCTKCGSPEKQEQ